ncbi:MAG: YbhB/YbcL family Raf kinase inhibitor-like protein [Lysobacteraceae bacterium]|nr:MAG: YbhB/YbcL family Raf kinase inhibitor-like protein [Xanthomonadaceae bacterium]
MRLHSESFRDMQPIPEQFAFGRPGDAGEACVLSTNRSPHLAWSDVPAGTRSFALLCVDGDAPTRADDVNQADRRVAASLPRAEFTHWLLVDLPPELRELAAGACGEGIVAHGKQAPPGPSGSRQGLNDYTHWFARDPDMAGDWFGYDGPCPPWNDELVHRYRFSLHALDVERLGLDARFTLADVRTAMAGHVLAEAALIGTYTLVAALRR